MRNQAHPLPTHGFGLSAKHRIPCSENRLPASTSVLPAPVRREYLPCPCTPPRGSSRSTILTTPCKSRQRHGHQKRLAILGVTGHAVSNQRKPRIHARLVEHQFPLMPLSAKPQLPIIPLWKLSEAPSLSRNDSVFESWPSITACQSDRGAMAGTSPDARQALLDALPKNWRLWK
jgi:hypothetical protein